MNVHTKKLIARLVAGLAASSFIAAAAIAETPDVEMKLSATSLYVNQELVVTISSKVFCDIQTAAWGLDDPQFKEIGGGDQAVFNPPKQYKYKFAKAGKYRMVADHGDMYCGNMAKIAMMTDIVVLPVVRSVPLATSLTTPTAPTTPAIKPATKPATKPVTKPCAKKGNQQVDPNCTDN